jgi:hypothetical protein
MGPRPIDRGEFGRGEFDRGELTGHRAAQTDHRAASLAPSHETRSQPAINSPQNQL